MTDPLHGPKAALGGTSDSASPQGKHAQRDTARQDIGDSKTVANRDNDPPRSESEVSSSDHFQKRTNRRKRRRRRGKAAQKAAVQTPHQSAQGAASSRSSQDNAQRADHRAPNPKTPHNDPRSNKDGRSNAYEKPQTHRQKHKPSKDQTPYRGHNTADNQRLKPLYAALDLGTNNCRLLIARPTRPGQFRVVDAFSRIVRLGEGLDASGSLSNAAMERAVGALKICAGKLSKYDIKNYRLIATEACRSAQNGETFLSRVRKETGLNLEIINRQTEARLAVSGCASLVERHTESLILFDIGGGSSEIAVVAFDGKRTPKLANHIKTWTSLPVGVVTLSERHGGQVVTREIFDHMVEEVSGLLSKHAPPDMLDFEPDLENFHLLGTSGTVTTLAGLHLNLQRYDRRRVDGLWLESEDVDRMLDKLISWDMTKRSQNPCIGEDRADLVLAGCAIMQAIRKKWPSRRLRVADRGLREGLLNDMMTSDGVWRKRKRRRNRRPKTTSQSTERQESS